MLPEHVVDNLAAMPRAGTLAAKGGVVCCDGSARLPVVADVRAVAGPALHMWQSDVVTHIACVPVPIPLLLGGLFVGVTNVLAAVLDIRADRAASLCACARAP